MPEYLVSSGLPSYPAGLTDKDAALVVPLYKAVNALAQQISALSGSVQYSQAEMGSVSQLVKLKNARTQKIFVKAGEDLLYGQMLALKVVGGKIVATKASADTLTKPALAVCDTPTGITSGTYGEAVFMSGTTAGISGTAFGTVYYLSLAGTIQSTPPVATGAISQIVGIGLGSAGLYLSIEPIGRRVSHAYKYNPTTIRVLYTDGTYADLPV